jgi:hypothetical protein
LALPSPCGYNEGAILTEQMLHMVGWKSTRICASNWVRNVSIVCLLLLVTLQGFVHFHHNFFVDYLDKVRIVTFSDLLYDDNATTGQKSNETNYFEQTTVRTVSSDVNTEVNSTTGVAISTPTPLHSSLGNSSIVSLSIDAVPSSEHSSRTADTPNSSSFNTISSKVVAIQGIDQLYEYLKGSWTANNPFCETIQELRSADPTVFITFNISFSCQELYERGEAGTGNYLAYFYGLRRVAWSYENVELIYHCLDAEEKKFSLILPWVMGRVPARSREIVAVEETEGAHCYYGPSNDDIRHDLRNMALRLYGLPEHKHPLSAFAEQLWSHDYKVGDSSLRRQLFVPQLPISRRPEDLETPPYSDADLDEAVLHFRCGDLMDSTNAAFSFMRFQGYVRHISPNATTIGIITQPYDDDPQQTRTPDSYAHVRDRCRAVVHGLVGYIKERYPAAHVSIRNNRTESITLSYLRMIMAKQTVSGISSFGVMPTAATFGTGYIRTPDRPSEPYYWVLFPRIDELTNGQIVLFEEPVMPVVEMKALWEEQGESGVLAWFLNDTVDEKSL